MMLLSVCGDEGLLVEGSDLQFFSLKPLTASSNF